MYQYAKNVDNKLVYPTQAEFAGVPNWQTHDALLRARGYLPLHNTPEQREGYEPVIAAFRTIKQSEARPSTRQVIVTDYEFDEDGNQRLGENGQPIVAGQHIEYVPELLAVDTSYIEVTDWEWLPVPEEEPLPPPVVEYSKYAIKCKLDEMGIWEQVKAAIQDAGYWDSFLVIQTLRSDNEELRAALPLMAALFPDVDIPGLLADCEV